MESPIQHAGRKGTANGKIRTYHEIAEYLDSHWSIPRLPDLSRMLALDLALGKPSEATPVLFVGGTNGKSLTINFAAKLLAADGIAAASYTAPHVLTYHERFSHGTQQISHKLFNEIANEVINTAQASAIQAHTSELLAAIAFCYFKHLGVQVALAEIEHGNNDPLNIAQARVVAITRIAAPTPTTTLQEIRQLTHDTMGIVKAGTYIVSGDQSKTTLTHMQTVAKEHGGHWVMPIRKVVDLAYPFEQLHGRCAALAERICQIFVDEFMDRQGVHDGLLTRQKIQRGRPTTEAKRQQELNPRKTLEQFWKEISSDMAGSFQLLEKEKPSILLDSAHNLDAVENLLLGIRLLHYQRPLKGLTLIVGAASGTLHSEAFTKMLRYFFKKTSGQIFICPVENALPGSGEAVSWDIEAVAHDLKNLKIKARACTSFAEAFALAVKTVDERHGLVAITGSRSIIQNYWHLQGMKKLN